MTTTSPPSSFESVGQSYPLCLPRLSFLQSPWSALTALWAPPPLDAELAPTTGDPAIRQTLARRDKRTRFTLRLPAVERCIIRGTPCLNPRSNLRIDDFGEPVAGLSRHAGETPSFASPPRGGVALNRSAQWTRSRSDGAAA